jgi:hypothetical protein
VSGGPAAKASDGWRMKIASGPISSSMSHRVGPECLWGAVPEGAAQPRRNEAESPPPLLTDWRYGPVTGSHLTSPDETPQAWGGDRKRAAKVGGGEEHHAP